jgi:hypothetical protein
MEAKREANAFVSKLLRSLSRMGNSLRKQPNPRFLFDAEAHGDLPVKRMFLYMLLRCFGVGIGP